ncbi:MAG: DUF4860 domain-containing protein [Lachnospiraceae bacterium]|jgi:hypothetical protein|nr:DUF4860 domain-containing protein [Lachnospiraceae bacterium]
MNANHRPSHTTDLLFSLGLFCVFAACAFIVIMIGIHVYQGTVEDMQNTYSTRTALSYVTEKIRQHDRSGCVSTASLDGKTVLVLSDSIDDTTYLTYIYADESALYELTIQEGAEPQLDMGEAIIEVKDFSIEEAENGFYQFSAADQSGDTVSLLLHLRSE